jgi:hypothetical protein
MQPQIRTVVVSAVVVLGLAAPALAGPPLLCHPYQIGTARSLPWGNNGWSEGASGYNVQNLVADTEALLTPSTPVIVRMETLRRAALYASTDRAVASQLLNRLMARGNATDSKGRADALALLDAAYVAGAFQEISRLGNNAGFRERAVAAREALGTADGYALIQKSIAARPDDPSIQFAAALIASDRDRSLYLAHAEKARAGAAKDPLLASNIDHVS